MLVVGFLAKGMLGSVPTLCSRLLGATVTSAVLHSSLRTYYWCNSPVQPNSLLHKL